MNAKRVLIVEDNVSFANVIARCTRDRGHPCSVAHTIAEALASIREAAFDVVVSDIHVGTETGLTVMDELVRTQPKVLRVLMSGSSGPQVGFPDYVDRYLVKPFELSMLFAAIEGGR